MSGLVVVGVDGSASSLAAVEAALRSTMARRTVAVGARLHWPAMRVPLGRSPLGPPEGGLSSMVERLLTAADERARSVAPEVDSSRAVVTGYALTVLEAQSHAAELVVVGSRGYGRLRWADGGMDGRASGCLWPVPGDGCT